MTAEPDQAPAQPAPAEPAPGTAPEWYADATLDALELAQQRRRAARDAEAERRKATAEVCTAAELPWYRAWLLSTGRTEAELKPDAAMSDSSDQ